MCKNIFDCCLYKNYNAHFLQAFQVWLIRLKLDKGINYLFNFTKLRQKNVGLVLIKANINMQKYCQNTFGNKINCWSLFAVKIV